MSARFAALIGVSVLAVGLGAAQAAGLPATTPPRITLVEVARELTLSQPDILWIRPGDADGRTLLFSSADTSNAANCVGACAEEFHPLIARANDKAAGDWSLVKRADGALQWVYQGHPLYTWTKEPEPGEVAINVGLKESEGAKLAERKIGPGQLLPPEGWTVARFKPESAIAVPAGITAKLVPAG